LLPVLIMILRDCVRSRQVTKNG